MNSEVISAEAAFSDREYEKYAEDLALNQKFFDKYRAPRDSWDFRQRQAMFLGNLAGKRLLDYGCGMGEETVYFAKLGAEVTSIDVSPVGIEITKNRAAANGVGHRVSAQLMDCTQTSFPDESFDVVHGLGILHHIGLHGGLMEVRRVLKTGGRAVFFEWMGQSASVDRLKNLLYGKEYSSFKSEHEQPLKFSDLRQEAKYFSVFRVYPYHLTYRLRRLLPFIRRSDWSARTDHMLLRLLPPLRRFAGGAIIYLEK